jgi:hypothetical protein
MLDCRDRGEQTWLPFAPYFGAAPYRSVPQPRSGTKLDECMRNTIDALALTLGQPGKLKVQYAFRFAD